MLFLIASEIYKDSMHAVTDSLLREAIEEIILESYVRVKKEVMESHHSK